MARLDDLEQVDHELEVFRAHAHDTLKLLEELEKLIHEFSELKQVYESIQKSALEKIDNMDRHIAKVEKSWSALETDTCTTLERLKNSELKLSERLEQLQTDHDTRWAKVQDEIMVVQDGLQIAQRNLRTELLRTVNDLRGESEQRFLEFNKFLDQLSLRHIDEIRVLNEHIERSHNTIVAELEASSCDYKECYNKFDLKLTTFESQIVKQKMRIFWLTLIQMFVIGIVVLFIFL